MQLLRTSRGLFLRTPVQPGKRVARVCIARAQSSSTLASAPSFVVEYCFN